MLWTGTLPKYWLWQLLLTIVEDIDFRNFIHHWIGCCNWLVASRAVNFIFYFFLSAFSYKISAMPRWAYYVIIPVVIICTFFIPLVNTCITKARFHFVFTSTMPDSFGTRTFEAYPRVLIFKYCGILGLENLIVLLVSVGFFTFDWSHL